MTSVVSSQTNATKSHNTFHSNRSFLVKVKSLSSKILHWRYHMQNFNTPPSNFDLEFSTARLPWNQLKYEKCWVSDVKSHSTRPLDSIQWIYLTPTYTQFWTDTRPVATSRHTMQHLSLNSLLHFTSYAILIIWLLHFLWLRKTRLYSNFITTLYGWVSPTGPNIRRMFFWVQPILSRYLVSSKNSKKEEKFFWVQFHVQ